MPPSRPPALLVADPSGKVLEHPRLLATVRSGDEVLLAPEPGVPLPEGGRLVHLPGRRPVGVDPDSGGLVLVSEFQDGRRRFVPDAVGALLPPGWTRTYLPGEAKADGPLLPQWAYTGAGWDGQRGGMVAWALHTDRRTHWDPERFSTPELKARVRSARRADPENRVLRQLETCALVYRCFTSQNVFYGRDEGALPVSTMCNAACVGCISDQPEDGPPASHERMEDGPSAEELARVAVGHLRAAGPRAMVSFGQGCEGEPLTRWRVIAEAIRRIRAQTDRGSLHINTNASLTMGLAALYDAGLDSIRVSLNSAVPDLYEAYYQPDRYGWRDVEASIALSRERGAYLALNLLTFPGISDREGEVEALLSLIQRHRVDQVQARSLCIDPLQYLEVARDRGAGGRPMGIARMLRVLREGAPWLRVGNFARGLGERGEPAGSPRSVEPSPRGRSEGRL